MKQQHTKKCRKVRWGRVMGLLLALVLCLSFAVQAFGETVTEPRPQTQVVVSRGDSLWTLIKIHNPSYDGDMNKAIYEVSKLNDLENATLYVGQHLAIPTDL